MANTAIVTGADRGLGNSLCLKLLQRGWDVVAGQYMSSVSLLERYKKEYSNSLHIVPLDVGSTESPRAAAEVIAREVEKVDLVINNAGIISPTMTRMIHEGPDYDEMTREYNVNSLGPLRVVESFLPLLEKGSMKRLCFVSSEAGSISRSDRESWFGYCMSKAALNMGVRLLHNNLRPAGYTFRLYHPGWVRSYMSGSKNFEATLEPDDAAEYALGHFLDPLEDEDTLCLVDYEGNPWPW